LRWLSAAVGSVPAVDRRVLALLRYDRAVESVEDFFELPWIDRREGALCALRLRLGHLTDVAETTHASGPVVGAGPFPSFVAWAGPGQGVGEAIFHVAVHEDRRRFARRVLVQHVEQLGRYASRAASGDAVALCSGAEVGVKVGRAAGVDVEVG
jgi:hypothetical protein